MKYIIVLLVALIAIPAVLPSQFRVERQIVISHSQEDTYSYLVNLDSWKEWSPWMEQEPSAEYSFDGIPGVVGSSTTWKGEIIGSGQQTLIKLEEPRYLETKLKFTQPNKSEATGSMSLEKAEEGVKVTWTLEGELSYPVERVFGPFMDSMVGKDFERGLVRLKERLETPADS